MLYIYVDGSCRRNGKAGSNGGFGVVVVNAPSFTDPNKGKVVQAFSQMESPTTNNRQEMKAILWALEKYGKSSLEETPIVFTDSSYAINTFTKWMQGWKAKGWLKGDNTIPENLDLVQLYDDLINQGYKITLQHIRGHQGNKWNEIADQLATGQIIAEEVLEKYGK